VVLHQLLKKQNLCWCLVVRL